jgi:superfamily II DNA or RNA helicase
MLPPGEGFDDPRLDALFLTMPILWKGTLAQYVGRLHRQHVGKTEVLVVDYVDDLVPFLRGRRQSGDLDIGHSAIGLSNPPLQQNQLDARENRNVPIIDFVDTGHPALLRNGSRSSAGHGIQMNVSRETFAERNLFR